MTCHYRIGHGSSADTVRCPWHHACFTLSTGEALRAPALNPVPRWRVDLRNGTVYVREKVELTAGAARPTRQSAPEAIVIVGGGAAGEAAADVAAVKIGGEAEFGIVGHLSHTWSRVLSERTNSARILGAPINRSGLGPDQHHRGVVYGRSHV